MSIIACPYCYQKIDTQDKEGGYADEPIYIRCPKCSKVFKFTSENIETIPSELSYNAIQKSIKILASHY